MSAVEGSIYAVFSTTGTGATNATDKIMSCKNATFKCDVDLPDVTTKDSGLWAEALSGIKSASIDFDGVWDEAGTASGVTVAEIMALIIAGNVKRKWAFVPAALGTAIPGWSGGGFFKNITIGSPNGQGCPFSGSIQNSGAVILFVS